jgi:hypothetical protein
MNQTIDIFKIENFENEDFPAENYQSKYNYSSLKLIKGEINYLYRIPVNERSAPSHLNNLNHLRYDSNIIQIYDSPENKYKNCDIMFNTPLFRSEKAKFLFYSKEKKFDSGKYKARLQLPYINNTNKEKKHTVQNMNPGKISQLKSDSLDKSICSKSTWKRAQEFLECVKDPESYEADNTLAYYLQTDQTDNFRAYNKSPLARWNSEIKVLQMESFFFLENNQKKNIIDTKDENSNIIRSKNFHGKLHIKDLWVIIFFVSLNLFFIMILFLSLSLSIYHKKATYNSVLQKCNTEDAAHKKEQKYSGIVSLFPTNKYERIFHRSFQDFQKNKNE